MRWLAIAAMAMAPAVAQAGEIWISNEKDDTLSVIDVETLEGLSTAGDSGTVDRQCSTAMHIKYTIVKASISAGADNCVGRIVTENGDRRRNVKITGGRRIFTKAGEAQHYVRAVQGRVELDECLVGIGVGQNDGFTQ